jgi:N-acetylglutamate synthase-like GNAT family acetyltransferase
MMDEITVRTAGLQDFEAIVGLLKQADLIPQDVLAVGTRYWVAVESGELVVGCLGMEFGKGAVLLKSTAVLPAYRKRGLAERLVDAALDFAARQGCQAAYLFSVRSGGYWQRLGFTEVPVAELLAALPDAYQVRYFRQIGKLEHEHAWRKGVPAGNEPTSGEAKKGA